MTEQETREALEGCAEAYPKGYYATITCAGCGYMAHGDGCAILHSKASAAHEAIEEGWTLGGPDAKHPLCPNCAQKIVSNSHNQT